MLGHHNLVKKNILHRDVSFGNILMTDRIEALGRRRGYLIDLDFATLIQEDIQDLLDDEEEKPKKARVTVSSIRSVRGHGSKGLGNIAFHCYRCSPF